MKIVVIGGNGHIGTYLTPNLVRAGHEVINVSRGTKKPYHSDQAWDVVKQINMDRQAEDTEGNFGRQIRNLKPDVVIDMICFKLESAMQLVEALEGDIQHLISCGSIWVHGPSAQVPTTIDQPRKPIGGYGTNKAHIESYLSEKARRDHFPATTLHPGHVVGSGWAPLNPAGHFNPEVFVRLAQGELVTLPNFGMETVHHVHASDVAQLFEKAIENWSNAVGESFHAVSPAAVTLKGYAEEAASWFGQAANLRFLPWGEWKQTVSTEEANATWDHISRSPNCSIAKGERLLNYRPRYSSFAAVKESVEWLIAHGQIHIDPVH